jgi:hypothetical protein
MNQICNYKASYNGRENRRRGEEGAMKRTVARVVPAKSMMTTGVHASSGYVNWPAMQPLGVAPEL